MAPSSKLSPNERLLRKRLAARLRQRRCRERKRESQKDAPPVSKVDRSDAKHPPPAGPTAAPRPTTTAVQHRPMFRPPAPYPPPPYGCPPPPLGYHHVPPPPYRHGHGHAHAPYPQRMMGTSFHPMTRPHHYGVPMPPTAPRTVSRCPSESSLEHSKVESVGSKDSASSATIEKPLAEKKPTMQYTPVDKSKENFSRKSQGKPLASVEKAAVAAMLSLKSNSSDSEESGSFSLPSSRQHPLLKNISLCRANPMPTATRAV